MTDTLNTELQQIQSCLQDAIEQKQPLRIVGGDSKAFYGSHVDAPPLLMSDYCGIIEYEPTELFITARAGTTLKELEAVLHESGQMLAFEPPRFSDMSTIGGVVATGISGPARPFTGSVRDYVLGIKCINGLGQVLSFGGQVMKNVAGYDLSRLLTGSLGTLGVILEVSLKVLPIPKHERSCRKQMAWSDVPAFLRDISDHPLPLSAIVYDGDTLTMRLSGNHSVVEEACEFLKFDEVCDLTDWWQSVRDQQHPFFSENDTVWRLSLPVTAEPDFGDASFLLDWGGAQYWLASKDIPETIFQQAQALGGSATLFYGGQTTEERFQPLDKELFTLHQGLKQAFDPHRILNPGRMYPGL